MNALDKRFTVELEKFGERLKQLRKTKKLTQVELEVLSKINNGDLSRIENGQTNIEFFTIVKLAEALQVQVGEFFA